MHVHLNVIVNHIIGCMCSVLALKKLSAAYKYSEQASVLVNNHLCLSPCTPQYDSTKILFDKEGDIYHWVHNGKTFPR